MLRFRELLRRLASRDFVTVFVTIRSAGPCNLVRFRAVTRMVTMTPVADVLGVWMERLAAGLRPRSQRGGHEFEPRAVHQISSVIHRILAQRELRQNLPLISSEVARIQGAAAFVRR